jgi:hypothetical protein
MIQGSPKWQTILQVVFVGLLVAVVLAQANPLYQFPNRDSGIFMYTGDQILKGKLLYLDIWDSKGPLIFYINAFALWLGHGSRWGVWGMEFTFLFLSALIGFNLMKKLWGLIPAIIGTLVWLSAFNNVARGGNFTEEYSLLFGFLAIYMFWLSSQNQQNIVYPFLIGVTLALSFLLRANNIGVQLSIILVIIISGFLDKNHRQSLRQFFLIGFGALLLLGLVALYFQILGTLDDLVRAAITFNFFYSEGGAGLSNLSKSFIRGTNLLGYLALIITLLGYVILIEKLPQSIRSNSIPIRNIHLLLLIGFPLEIVLSGLSGNNYPHYYISWSPYIGLLSGLLVSLGAHLKTRHSLALPLMIFLVAFLNLDVLGQYQTSFTRILFDRSTGIELVHPVAQYIRDNTEPTDTVLVWGAQPYINLLAHRDSPTGIIFYPQLARSPFTDELNARFYQDLVGNRPVLIADMVNPDNDTIPFIDPVQREVQEQRLKRFDPPFNMDQVFDFIHSNYHLEDTIQGVAIYRLDSSTSK